ncbi:MAG TPA: hypothetical protein VHU84_12780 [Lacipirellulaceae bacterium]|nr:hypothetical protein [Lacipirellulaceae bacterium]
MRRNLVMVNISVPFPDDLWDKAEAAARQRGLTLDEFVRRCVSTTVDRAIDPFFTDRAAFDGDVPADLAEHHDRYLYGDDT